MLKALISFIDQRLTEFNVNYGLAELVTEVTEENSRTFPGVYYGKDDYKSIDLERDISYHRVDGKVDIQHTLENTIGCTKGLVITYPLLLIGCLPRESECDQYALDGIANGVASKIEQTKFTKTIRAEIKAWSIESNVRSINTIRNDIWNQEYSNIPMQANFNRAYFCIGYELIIKADSGCLNLICQ